MRKQLRGYVMEDLYEALILLGYNRTNQHKQGEEWRHGWWHVSIRGRGSRRNLQLHADLPVSLPPFHKARHSGKDVQAELHKILDAYKKRRLAK